MNYEGRIFRPPSEAASLIIQVTVGCAHNRCSFCSMYREKQFRIKPLEEVLETILKQAKETPWVKRIFIADGDALILPMAYWRSLLSAINTHFPNIERVTSYGTPKDVIRKTDEELSELKDNGLQMIYMGLETGSDRLLEKIQKGVTSAEMILAGQKLKKSGVKQSITVISGIGAREHSEEHARLTAAVLNQMDPEYIGLLTLLLEDDTPMLQEVRRGEMALLSSREVLEETRLLIELLQVTDCHFRSNHASNYLALAGHLPDEKNRLLHEINQALKEGSGIRGEGYRRL